MSLEISQVMKYRFPSLAAIAGIMIILCLPNVYSDYTTNSKYLIQANGYASGTQTILESSLDLQLTAGIQSGNNMLSTLDTGLITIGGVNYLSSGSWQTVILRNGNFLLLQGDAQDQNGNVIHLNFFGRIITSGQGGTVYVITGKITGAQTLKVSYSAEVILVGTNTSQQNQNPVTTPTTQNQTQSNAVTITIVPNAYQQYNTLQLYFSPSVVNVNPGTTIIWKNTDSVPHRIESGLASAQIGNNSAPVFTPDGMINSSIIYPGQSFQYTITNFDQRLNLSDAAIKYLGLDPHQTYRDITFFDPNYPFMQGAIGPTTPAFTQTQTSQVTILDGASTATSAKFLSPQAVQVPPGSTLILKNDDSVGHRILSGHSQDARVGQQGAPGGQPRSPYFIPDGIVDTGIIAPGQTYSLTTRGGTGSIIFYDSANTWLNGIVIISANSGLPPVQVSILPGAYSSQGSASQSNQFYYNQYYSPNTIQISPGTALVWTNNDNVDHQIWTGTNTQGNVNKFKPDGKVESPLIPPGASFEAIINDTGLTTFYDPSYTWMSGTIVSMPTVSGQQNIQGYYKNANPFLH